MDRPLDLRAWYKKGDVGLTEVWNKTYINIKKDEPQEVKNERIKLAVCGLHEWMKHQYQLHEQEKAEKKNQQA